MTTVAVIEVFLRRAEPKAHPLGLEAIPGMTSNHQKLIERITYLQY